MQAGVRRLRRKSGALPRALGTSSSILHRKSINMFQSQRRVGTRPPAFFSNPVQRSA